MLKSYDDGNQVQAQSIGASNRWQRCIALVDMNAFFASIEQLDYPELRGQPVAVTNGVHGSCIITCSYEARAYGIRTGMRWFEALARCPHLIQRSSRVQRYVTISKQMIDGLSTLTPDIEVFSIDEAFLDLTRCQHLYRSHQHIAQAIQQCVYHHTGLPASIGLSGDKTTAKFAAKCDKPRGVTVIAPDEAKQRLAHEPVTALCGISEGIARFLARYGVVVCQDIESVPIDVLAQRFGNLGKRIWYMCQGCDPDPVQQRHRPPKSIGHSKVLPPNTRSSRLVLSYLRYLCEKVAQRLRMHHLYTQRLAIGLRLATGQTCQAHCRLTLPCQEGLILYQHARTSLGTPWQGQVVVMVWVTALAPCAHQQMDCLTHMTPSPSLAVMDAINQRYGSGSIMPATLLGHQGQSEVIAPAWRPSGHRQTIQPKRKALTPSRFYQQHRLSRR